MMHTAHLRSTPTAVDKRPDILTAVSTTQMDELERHYAEQDQQAWNNPGTTYGWTLAQCQQVWTWFDERTALGQD